PNAPTTTSSLNQIIHPAAVTRTPVVLSGGPGGRPPASHRGTPVRITVHSGFTRAHHTPGRGRSGFSRVVPLAAYGLYAIDTAFHSLSLRQLSDDSRSRSGPPAQTSL